MRELYDPELDKMVTRDEVSAEEWEILEDVHNFLNTRE